MKNKVLFVLIILILVLGIGYTISSLSFWEKEGKSEGFVEQNNLGEGGGYRIQILERGIG